MAGSVVLEGLRHVWVTLDQVGFPLALMGGLALSIWKHVRATRGRSCSAARQSKNARPRVSFVVGE